MFSDKYNKKIKKLYRFINYINGVFKTCYFFNLIRLLPNKLVFVIIITNKKII